MLSKVNRLIRRTAQSLAACEASLQKLNAEKEKLAEKERLYDMQLKNLQSLLDMKELLGEVVFRQDIFYSLRKVAVIQQQIAEINLEKQKIAERRKILNKEIVQQQAQRKHWWLKGEKYDRLKKRIKKQLLNQMLYQDELEQEEKYNGRSQENLTL
ncbi:TPA: type III secretion protein [Escherichia coli]|nr:type III secretion protein [Escherichia coli]